MINSSSSPLEEDQEDQEHRGHQADYEDQEDQGDHGSPSNIGRLSPHPISPTNAVKEHPEIQGELFLIQVIIPGGQNIVFFLIQGINLSPNFSIRKIVRNRPSKLHWHIKPFQVTHNITFQFTPKLYLTKE